MKSTFVAVIFLFSIVLSSCRCIATMLRQAQDENLSRRKEVLKYIGNKFRIKLRCPEWYTDIEVAEFLFK